VSAPAAALQAAARAEAQRILDAAARRILAERLAENNGKGTKGTA
jgi:hypothetical protein